jgi:hypothetical protein
MDCDYWKGIVSKLKILSECNWAAHVLTSDIENLEEAIKCLPAEEIIENTIYAYEDWNAQPYCDEILFQFEKQKIIEVFDRIENPSENMNKGFFRFIEL